MATATPTATDALRAVPNPFHDRIVSDPWQANAGDVPAIQRGVSRLCCDFLDQVRRDGQNRSAVIYGEVGSGKTHLLRRLQARWLGPRNGHLNDARREIVFIAVKLQPNPNYLWSYLRQGLADDLLREPYGGLSQLRRILLRRLAEARGAQGDLRAWFEWLQERYPDAAEREKELKILLDAVDRDARLGRDLKVVLMHLLMDRHRYDAEAWLRGDPLPTAALDALGLAPPDEADAENQAREAVAATCRLAGRATPVVFCFDQLEALQNGPGDFASLGKFGTLVMDLSVKTSNTLLITCVKMQFLEPLRSAVGPAAWDRMAIATVSVPPLTWDQAARLIQSRLESVPALQALRAGHPDRPLWPLDAAKLKGWIGAGLPARDVLRHCADLFEAARSGRTQVPAPLPFESIWRDQLDAARRSNGPDMTGEIVVHGLPGLLRQAAPEWDHVLDGRPDDVDLVWKGPDGRIGVHVSRARDNRGVWRPFERLERVLSAGRVEKLVVLRDPRYPITGKASQQKLEALVAAGARVISPQAEVLAALDALRTLLSRAAAGDTEASLASVESWLRENLPDSLRRLVDELVRYPGVGNPVDPPPDAVLAARLAALLEDRPIRTLADAAEALGVAPADLESAIRGRPDACLTIDGDPLILLRRPAPSTLSAPAPDAARPALAAR